MECNICKEEKTTTLFLGQNICIDCLKEMTFELKREIAKKKIAKDYNFIADAKEIIALHGNKQQLLKTVEELNELANEVVRSIANGETTANLVNELAVVVNMIEQVKIICSIEDEEINAIRKQKNKIVLK